MYDIAHNITNSALTSISRFPCEVRIRAVPLQPCRRHGKKRKEDEPDAVIGKPRPAPPTSAGPELRLRQSEPAMTPPYDLSPMYARMDPQLQSSQVSSTVLDSPISLYNQTWNYPSPEFMHNSWSQSPKKFENQMRGDWRMTPSPLIRDATPVETKFDWDVTARGDLISAGEIKTDPDSTTLTPGRGTTTPDVKAQPMTPATPSSPLGSKVFNPGTWDENGLSKVDDLSDALNLSKVIEEKSISASQESLDDKMVLSPSTLAPPSPFSPPSPNAPTNLLPTSIPLNLEPSTMSFSNEDESTSLPNTQNLQSPRSSSNSNDSQLSKVTFGESFLKPQTPPPIKAEKSIAPLCTGQDSAQDSRENKSSSDIEEKISQQILDQVKLENPLLNNSRDDFKIGELLYNNNNKQTENLNYTSEQWYPQSQYGTESSIKQELTPGGWLNTSCSVASLLDIPSHLNLPYSAQDTKPYQNWGTNSFGMHQQQTMYQSNPKNYLRLNSGSPQLGYQVIIICHT